VIEEINFNELNKISYLIYREQIIDLYFQAFTTGEYAQFLERSSVVNTIDELINIGGGILALFGERPVGILVASPLFAHFEFPITDSKDFFVDNTIYINEVVVDIDFRGRGIAEKMINVFLKNIPDKYYNAVIRVWDKNTPALSLYNKLNFEPIASIIQQKLKASGEKFEMEKIYLYKKLKTKNDSL
jgi:ribosomal protein S18 acetylase RimI-like enzyme